MTTILRMWSTAHLTSISWSGSPDSRSWENAQWCSVMIWPYSRSASWEGEYYYIRPWRFKS